MNFDKYTIEFLTCIFELLDDNVLKSFLEFVYEKKYFKVTPFKNYKEFFLYLIFKDNKISVNLNPKCKSISSQSNTIIFQHIDAIMFAIKSFFLENYPDNKKFKKFLNYVVKKNIDERCCYGIYKYNQKDKNPLYQIQKTILSPISGRHYTVVKEFYIEKLNNKLYITDNRGHCKVSFNNFEKIYSADRNIIGYKKSVNAIEKKIKELYKKVEKEKCCHICNPTRKSTAKDKKHMCENCKNLIEAIYKNDKELLNKQAIVYAIKKKDEDLRSSMNINEIRHLRYNNLINYLIKLNNQNKIKNKKEIECLIPKVFDEFRTFYFS